MFKKDLRDLDRQVPAILAARDAIEAVFAPNIFRTLDDAGNRMPPEEIWRALSPSGGNHEDRG